MKEKVLDLLAIIGLSILGMFLVIVSAIFSVLMTAAGVFAVTAPIAIVVYVFGRVVGVW